MSSLSTDNPKISIQFCRNCKDHSYFTRHNELRYKKVFESFKSILSGLGFSVFEESQARIGAFEVRVGNYIVFSKLQAGLFPDVGKVCQYIVEITKLKKGGYLVEPIRKSYEVNPQSTLNSPLKRSTVKKRLSTSTMTHNRRVVSARERPLLLNSAPALICSSSVRFFSDKKFKKEEYIHLHKPELILYGDRKIPNVKKNRPFSAGPAIQKAKHKKITQKLKTQPPTILSYGDNQMSKSQITAKLMKMIMEQEGQKTKDF